MSTLPLSLGTQKLCITSTERRLTRTGRPAGMTSSLAVVSVPAPGICSLGYSNLNHHCSPVAVTS